MFKYDIVILTLFSTILMVAFAYSQIFKNTVLIKSKKWLNLFPLALVINAICFASVALYFNYLYGYITDDFNYYRGSLIYTGGFFEITNGNQFMYLITRPLRLILHLDRASLHILFGGMGFVGSLLYLSILNKRVDFTKKANNQNLLIMYAAILCFPNIMVWGRMYGKDSTTLFLGAIYLVGAYHLITDRKMEWKYLIITIFPVMMLYKLRAHTASVLAIGILIGLYIKTLEVRKFKNPNIALLYKAIIPMLLTIALVIGSVYSLKKMTRKDTVSVTDVQQTLVNATRIGAYGGSATSLASEYRENPNIVLQPKQISINMFMLLFAPMPWQVRGAADLLALLSNVLLLLIIIRFIRSIEKPDTFQKYLIIVCLLLILILSFMTGNVGLILRQKLILLPFLFLSLFWQKPINLSKRIKRKNARLNYTNTIVVGSKD
jgi:hypothetical protein